MEKEKFYERYFSELIHLVPGLHEHFHSPIEKKDLIFGGQYRQYVSFLDSMKNYLLPFVDNKDVNVLAVGIENQWENIALDEVFRESSITLLNTEYRNSFSVKKYDNIKQETGTLGDKSIKFDEVFDVFIMHQLNHVVNMLTNETQAPQMYCG